MNCYKVTLLPNGDKMLPYVQTVYTDNDDPDKAVALAKESIAKIGYFPHKMSIEERMNILVVESVVSLMDAPHEEKEELNSIERFINAHGGVENFRCFAQMDKRCSPIPGIGYVMSTDVGRTWTECRVDESEYKIKDGYKITLRPIDKTFAADDFYIDTFLDFIEDDIIIIKNDDNMRVKHVSLEVPLCGIATIRHEFDEVVNE